jgi:hypothetical protein
VTTDDTARDGPLPARARPSTVDTPRGRSVLYLDRYLYSRYDPEKTALEAVRDVPLREGTLVLCVSPVLGYGLDLLLSRLPADSFVLAVEADENLMALSAASIPRETLSNPSLLYVRTASVARALETVDALSQGPFKRCLRIDLSGGAALNDAFYRALNDSINEYISRYWKNRLTIMKLGRSYARNFFSNLASLPSSHSMPIASVERTVFVAGAGPSLEEALSFVAERRESLYVLSVDAAIPALRDAGITPDAVALVESQFWITRAFTGFRQSGIPVFADLTANPQAVAATGGPVSFFFTPYARARFLKRFASLGVAVPEIPPLGSVGLAALELALAISPSETRILFAGLDFSWGSGFTHCRGAPSVREAHARTTRLSSAQSVAFRDPDSTMRERGKGGSTVNTDPALSGYAALCVARFGGETRLFDLGSRGLETGCRRVSFEEADAMIRESGPGTVSPLSPLSVDASMLSDFLAKERESLLAIRDALTGKGSADSARLLGELSERDYLFLHFPDGYRGADASSAFLKRARIELEYFLKTLERPRAL